MKKNIHAKKESNSGLTNRLICWYEDLNIKKKIISTFIYIKSMFCDLILQDI